jgi:phosphoenolpyruvate synthase/pyruvate phosphate dikinase
MKIRTLLAMLIALSVGIPAIVGCDETVKDKKEVEVKDDGTVKKSEEKVVRQSDGTVKKTEEKTVDAPNK